MFSSNPFSQMVPTSTANVFSSTNSFFDHEKDEVDFNYYYHQKIDNPFISGDFHFHHPPVTENHVLQFSEGSGLMQDCEEEDLDHDDLLDSVISPYRKKIPTSKTKDGHSKIYTARGPRDRRVRLSIDISRKFFCLQDLLGFDKASKTLDWLLTKSLTAIKDLVEETNNCSSSSTLTDHQSKVKFLETIKKDSDEESCQKKKTVVDGKKKVKMTQRICKLAGGSQENSLARDQSRAEARARARERTKEKMRVKRFDDIDLKTTLFNNSDGCESSGCWGGQIETHCDYQETSNQSKDSSFQNKYFALSKFRSFQEQQQQGDNNANSLKEFEEYLTIRGS